MFDTPEPGQVKDTEKVTNDPISGGEIINFTTYFLVLFMTIWSFYKIIYKDPGYVPRNYNYKQENMGEAESYVFEKIRAALASTER